MSDSSRTVPQEQLPSENLHPRPMPTINLDHLCLDSATRSAVVNEIAKACRDLGFFQVINHGISQSIMDRAVEAASVFFKLQEKFQEGLQLLSVNSYPKLSHGATTIGLAPHSDYGFLTISLTSCQGLDVLDRNSNSWKTVQQLPQVLHVHIGDHMEVLSNGHIKTVVHRALLNPEEARISIASIHGFGLHEKVACAKELVDEENPRKYKESSFSDFLDHLMANMDNKHRNFLESLRM